MEGREEGRKEGNSKEGGEEGRREEGCSLSVCRQLQLFGVIVGGHGQLSPLSVHCVGACHCRHLLLLAACCLWW